MLHRPPNSSKLICKIDVTILSLVMAVVILTLLIIEMVALVPGGHHGVGIDLPRISFAQKVWGANREDAMIIAILRDGNIFFGSDRVPCEQLPQQIRERLREGTERRIYIKADARVHYGTIKDVVDVVHAAGLYDITFIVDQGRNPMPRAK